MPPFVFIATTAVLLASASAQADTPWTHDPAEDAIGRIYYYERTNTDGSLDERVAVFRRDATNIEVYKENGLCRRAALVTAELDLETLSAHRITGGQLQPGGLHADFAFLERNAQTGAMDMRVQLPDMEIRNEVMIENEHWHLFDFDLASLTVATPHLDDPQDGFGFGLALLWADPSAPDPLFWMGEVQASHGATESHLGHHTERFDLTGSAFGGDLATGTQGQLWLHADDGHVVDAVFPAPNHPGYTDFRLRLLHVSDGGDAEWTAHLTRHFENCER